MTLYLGAIVLEKFGSIQASVFEGKEHFCPQINASEDFWYAGYSKNILRISLSLVLVCESIGGLLLQ